MRGLREYAGHRHVPFVVCACLVIAGLWAVDIWLNPFWTCRVKSCVSGYTPKTNVVKWRWKRRKQVFQPETTRFEKQDATMASRSFQMAQNKKSGDRNRHAWSSDAQRCDQQDQSTLEQGVVRGQRDNGLHSGRKRNG